jgi:hypothetical protein
MRSMAALLENRRTDLSWLCTQPQDMRAGADRLLNTLGSARAHHGYLIANLRATRIKLLMHDGFGVWCATPRLHLGRFVWLGRAADHDHDPVTADQLGQRGCMRERVFLACGD